MRGTSLKLVDNFTNHSSIVSSIESEVNTHHTKVWINIDRLLIIWKSDLSDKIKQNFFQAVAVFTLNICLNTFSTVGCHQWCFAWFLVEFQVFQLHTIVPCWSFQRLIISDTPYRSLNIGKKRNKTEIELGFYLFGPLLTAHQCIWLVVVSTTLKQTLSSSLAFLESLMPLKNWCSIHARWFKSSLKHSIRFCGIFTKFKIAFYCISFF